MESFFMFPGVEIQNVKKRSRRLLAQTFESFHLMARDQTCLALYVKTQVRQMQYLPEATKPIKKLHDNNNQGLYVDAMF